jgi:hypothetical protein
LRCLGRGLVLLMAPQAESKYFDSWSLPETKVDYRMALFLLDLFAFTIGYALACGFRMRDWALRRMHFAGVPGFER